MSCYRGTQPKNTGGNKEIELCNTYDLVCLLWNADWSEPYNGSNVKLNHPKDK